VGDDRLQEEGAAQEVKGSAQRTMGEAKSAIKKGADKAADAINRKL
jgi:uncharacterized protein YjbJ (UPF0337 family)